MIYTLTQSVVQAITEFLPISSSGHLLITKHLFGLKNPGLILDLTLHLGTTVCMAIYLWRHRTELFRDRQMFKRLSVYALVVTAVTGAVGVWFAPVVREFYSLGWLAVNYLVMASLLMGSRWLYVQPGLDRGAYRLHIGFAILIGLIQTIAILPGISRSGMTIIGMMALGFEPVFAFYFSFLIAIPTIMAAAGYEFFHAFQVGGVVAELSQLVLGFLVTMFLGYPVLVLLKMTLQRRYFHLFGVYCLMLSGLLFWLSRS